MRYLIITFLMFISSAHSADREPAIIMERTGCYGECPSYVFTVFSSGEFVWEGREFVEKLGLYRGHLDPRLFAAAMKFAEEASYTRFKRQYWTKDDGCKEQWTDDASVRLYIQTEQSETSIHHYLGCRGFEREDELLQLEKNVDEVFGTTSWISAR